MSIRGTVAVAAAALALVVAGCGDDGADDPPESAVPAVPAPSGSPVGERVLPDLVPEPPVDVHTKGTGDTWQLEFSSVLVNVGDGEFRLAVSRPSVDDDWSVTQAISHTSGVEEVPADADIEGGGDGHDHWHVHRMVTYQLVAVDGSGQTAPDCGLTDAKVGFCIYDFGREIDGLGPDDAVFSREGCQPEDALTLAMGLLQAGATHMNGTCPVRASTSPTCPTARIGFGLEPTRRPTSSKQAPTTTRRGSTSTSRPLTPVDASPSSLTSAQPRARNWSAS